VGGNLMKWSENQQHQKDQILVFLIILVIFCGYALAEGPLIPSSPDTQISEEPLRAELAFKLGSNKPNEDFYKLRSFTVDKKNGQIYILDTGNSRIQCFSKEGKFLFSFARRGQGPGELSNNASKIKILSDGNIYVIDNRQRRINVYNLEGKFLFAGKTKFEFSADTASFTAFFNDIVLLNNTYYLSSFFLEENHNPIHISRTLGKVDSSFGIFVEPAVNQLKRINKLPHPYPWRMYYADSGITKLIAANQNEIIFSQASPYRLIKYDTKGQVLKDITGDVDFDTYHHVEYVSEKGWTTMYSYPDPPTGIVLDVSINRDDQLVVPYLNQDQDFFYIDIYDLDLNLISRYKMKNIISIKKEEYICMGNVMIDNDDNLYALVISEESYPQLVKYKLIFE
jgi:hypothetical protein